MKYHFLKQRDILFSTLLQYEILLKRKKIKFWCQNIIYTEYIALYNWIMESHLHAMYQIIFPCSSSHTYLFCFKFSFYCREGSKLFRKYLVKNPSFWLWECLIKTYPKDFDSGTVKNNTANTSTKFKKTWIWPRVINASYHINNITKVPLFKHCILSSF